MADYDKVMRILMENADKDFVQRVIDPTRFPVINNKDGTRSTHRMAWSTVGDKAIVYPTVINQNGYLQELTDPDAVDYAIKNKQFIEFQSPQDADWFSKNYKKAWEKK